MSSEAVRYRLGPKGLMLCQTRCGPESVREWAWTYIAERMWPSESEAVEIAVWTLHACLQVDADDGRASLEQVEVVAKYATLGAPEDDPAAVLAASLDSDTLDRLISRGVLTAAPGPALVLRAPSHIDPAPESDVDQLYVIALLAFSRTGGTLVDGKKFKVPRARVLDTLRMIRAGGSPEILGEDSPEILELFGPRAREQLAQIGQSLDDMVNYLELRAEDFRLPSLDP